MKYFLLIIGALVGLSLFAQDNISSGGQRVTISGKITDASTGLPLAGATIFIHELKTGAIANNQGVYTTRPINEGRYLIEVTYQGYATAIENITVSGNVEKDFALKPTVVEQEAVTVTGVSSATRVKQSPQPVVIVKQQDFINTASTNAIDALSKLVPGVSGISTGPAIAKPVIRGLGYNRVVTVNDGIRQEGQQWGDEHGIEIDDYSIQRVEVLKGPASIMYGSDALAGVINIITQTPAPEGTLKADLLSEYQTNSNLRGFYGNIAATKNGFSWNVYGSYKGAQDYQNKYDGYVFNSKFYNKNFGGMLGYQGNWGNSKIMVSNYDQHLGIVEGARDSITGQFTKPVPGGGEAIATNADFHSITPLVPFQHIRHFKVATDNTFNLGQSRLDLTAGYQHNQRQEFGNPDDTNTPGAYFDLQTINYALRLHLPYTGNWKTTIGATGMYQTNDNKAEEALIPEYNLLDAGAFVFTQYAKDKLTVSGGARFDNRHINSKPLYENGETKFSPFTKDFSNISGNVGLSYLASDAVTWKFNVARGFRAPNMAELASNGAHEGTNRYEVGDNNLKSETSFQLDGGFEIANQHISFAANLFYNHINNFVFYQKVLNRSGQDSILIDAESGDALTLYKFSQHTANLYGGELTLDIHPHPLDWLHFENSFAYTRAQFTEPIDGTKNIPFVPAARLLSELRGNFLSKGKTIRNLYASLESDYNFKQDHPFTGYNTETPTSSYWLIGASIGTDIASKGKTLFSLHFSANNLTDVAYQNHLSRLKYTDVNNATGRQGVYQMGRNFSFKINVPLRFNI